ncbi:MAG: hypothetical protein K0R54_667 [Clostridiaceae bacterium]|nr:hypothetical protein [Clostridiaceae bacterium]
MRGKEKLLLIGMCLIFFITVGMFLYQNVYSEAQVESNKVSVLIAKKDIPEGTEFNKDNVGQYKINKDFVFADYTLASDFSKINGKLATADILTNEILNNKKVSNENSENKLFTIKVKPDFYSDIKVQDNIRVYVQIFDKKTLETSLYKIFDKKQVLSVAILKNNKGTDTLIDSLEVTVSDEEALNYYNAMKLGEIIALKYNDITEEDKLSVPQFKIDSPEIKKLTESLAEETTKEAESVESTVSKISYTVKTGETMETIATSFAITKDEILKDNPGITEVKPGDTIMITIK